MSDVYEREENMESDARIYEVGYLLLPTIKEEDVPAVYGNLKELISSVGGMVISDDMPKMIPLAYTISKVITNVRQKFNSAYFGWVKFSLDAEKINGLKEKLDLDQSFLRFLVVKTVKENTIATKRFTRPDAHRKLRTEKEEGAGTEAVPANNEEIDKEIEALVA